MGPTLVLIDDVETTLMRPLTSSEQGYVQGLCEQASVLLRAALPDIDARMAAHATDPATGVAPELVAVVLAGVIKAYLDNPNGLASNTTTTGPYSHSQTFVKGGGGSSAGLQITREDLARLSPLGRSRTPGMVQLHPTRAMRPHWRDGYGYERGWRDVSGDCP